MDNYAIVDINGYVICTSSDRSDLEEIIKGETIFEIRKVVLV